MSSHINSSSALDSITSSYVLGDSGFGHHFNLLKNKAVQKEKDAIEQENKNKESIDRPSKKHLTVSKSIIQPKI